MSAVEIIATPPGEAPYDVRKAWVGLTLPLLQPGRWKSKGFGVLTGPKGTLGAWLLLRLGRHSTQIGYIVDSATAIEILGRTQPEAARWWRENVPQFAAPGRRFVFAERVCREVPEVVWPPPPVDPNAPLG